MKRVAMLRGGILLAMTAGCSAKPTEDLSTKSVTVTNAEVGELKFVIEAAHWGTHTAFGNGQGRGGFLDPAHTTVHLAVTASVTTPDGKSLTSHVGSYDDWVRDWHLFQTTWDTAKDDDALEAWTKAWKVPKVDRCDVAGGVALTMARPGSSTRTWVWIKARGRELAKHVKVDAADCAALTVAVSR